MPKIPFQNPGSSEVQSPLISGITDGLNKISGMLNMQTRTDTIQLQEVYIDATDRFRIYEAPEGQKNWLRSPNPIIRKNDNIINPTIDFYTVDYVGGSITFAEDARQTLTDKFTAEVTFIIESDLKMPLKADLDPDTNKLISSQIPDTLATKEELKPLQDKLEMDKGYFTDAEQLKRTYPVGEVGWHAVVGTTDTVWIWDGDTGTWVNSGTSDINASKVPFTKTTEVDSTNVQDAIEKLGINKANKGLTNVDNTTFKNKGNSAGLAYTDLINVSNTTFKQKGDQAGLATKDLANVDNSIFKAKGDTAGLSYKDLTNVTNSMFRAKGFYSGLETACLCNCTKSGSTFNITPVHMLNVDEKLKLLYFKASHDFTKGDTFNVAGTPVSFISNSNNQSTTPDKVFRQHQLVSVLYDKPSTNLYLVNPQTPFLDLSNVEIKDLYEQGMNANFGIVASMYNSFDSATNTFTLSFPANGIDMLSGYPGWSLPFSTNFLNKVTNESKFIAPNRSGSLINYSAYMGNILFQNFAKFSIDLGQACAVLDIQNQRIHFAPSVLFKADQYAKGIQLPVDLRLKNDTNFGNYLRFGDSDLCYLAELADDQLTIHGRRLRLESDSANSTDGIVLTTTTNSNIQLNTSGTGKILYNNTEVAKVDLSNTTATQFDLKLTATSNFINHKCTATKSGTVFTLKVSPALVIITNIFAVSFYAPANFNAGDTFTIQFSTSSYSDLIPYINGKIATKGFLLDDVVTFNVNLNSKKVFFRSTAGGLELPADYTNGGIILPNNPEEIQKVTKRGTGICPAINIKEFVSRIGYADYGQKIQLCQHNYGNSIFVLVTETNSANYYIADLNAVTLELNTKIITASPAAMVSFIESSWKYIFSSYGTTIFVYDRNLTKISSIDLPNNRVARTIALSPHDDSEIFISTDTNIIYKTKVNGSALTTPTSAIDIGLDSPYKLTSLMTDIDGKLLATYMTNMTWRYYNIDSSGNPKFVLSINNKLQSLRYRYNYHIYQKSVKVIYFYAEGAYDSNTIDLSNYIKYSILKVAICSYGALMFVLGADSELIVLSRDIENNWIYNGSATLKIGGVNDTTEISYNDNAKRLYICTNNRIATISYSSIITGSNYALYD